MQSVKAFERKLPRRKTHESRTHRCSSVQQVFIAPLDQLHSKHGVCSRPTSARVSCANSAQYISALIAPFVVKVYCLLQLFGRLWVADQGVTGIKANCRPFTCPPQVRMNLR